MFIIPGQLISYLTFPGIIVHEAAHMLFFRLFSVEIRLPPLRERKGDIVTLSLAFLEDICNLFNKQIAGFSPEVLNLFDNYNWPGNVRQLRQEIERLVALTPTGELITLDKCSQELLSA